MPVNNNLSDETWRDQLSIAIGALVAACNPQRIVLFGSRARGDAHPGSDIDLLLIVDDDVDRLEAAAAAVVAVAGLWLDLDVVLVRASFAEVEAERAGTIVRPALREGQVLYSRAA